MLLTPPYEVEYSSEYYLTCPQDQATWSSWILCLCPRCIWCRRHPSSRCCPWCHRRVWTLCRSAVVFQTRGPISFQKCNASIFNTDNSTFHGTSLYNQNLGHGLPVPDHAHAIIRHGWVEVLGRVLQAAIWQSFTHFACRVSQGRQVGDGEVRFLDKRIDKITSMNMRMRMKLNLDNFPHLVRSTGKWLWHHFAKRTTSRIAAPILTTSHSVIVLV